MIDIAGSQRGGQRGCNQEAIGKAPTSGEARRHRRVIRRGERFETPDMPASMTVASRRTDCAMRRNFFCSLFSTQACPAHFAKLRSCHPHRKARRRDLPDDPHERWRWIFARPPRWLSRSTGVGSRRAGFHVQAAKRAQTRASIAQNRPPARAAFLSPGIPKSREMCVSKRRLRDFLRTRREIQLSTTSAPSPNANHPNRRA